MSHKTFELVGRIGGGAFAEVFLIKSGSGTNYALKIVDVSEVSEEQKKQLKQEADVLKMLDHPHIISYYVSLELDALLCIVTEYCSRGNLSMLLNDRAVNMSDNEKILPEEIVIDWLYQLTQALDYLHQLKILHRDIKTENIFLNEKFQAILGDFGLARVLKFPENMATTFCGTPHYMSPELYFAQPYNEKSDIWALGVVLYVLLTFRKPFEGYVDNQIASEVCSSSFTPVSGNYTAEIKNLLSQMLDKKQQRRPSAKVILEYDIFKTFPDRSETVQRFAYITSNKQQVTTHETYKGPYDFDKILGELAKIPHYEQKGLDNIEDRSTHITKIEKHFAIENGQFLAECQYYDMKQAQNKLSEKSLNENGITIKDECTTTEINNKLVEETETCSDSQVITETTSVHINAKCEKQEYRISHESTTCNNYTGKNVEQKQPNRKHNRNFYNNRSTGILPSCSIRDSVTNYSLCGIANSKLKFTECTYGKESLNIDMNNAARTHADKGRNSEKDCNEGFNIGMDGSSNVYTERYSEKKFKEVSNGDMNDVTRTKTLEDEDSFLDKDCQKDFNTDANISTNAEIDICSVTHYKEGWNVGRTDSTPINLDQDRYPVISGVMASTKPLTVDRNYDAFGIPERKTRCPIDKAFESQVLVGIKQTREPRKVENTWTFKGKERPVLDGKEPPKTDRHFINNCGHVSDYSKNRLNFIYKTVEKQNGIKADDLPQPDKNCSSNRLFKFISTIFKPKRMTRIPVDIDRQAEITQQSRLAFLDKMRQNKAR